MSIRAPYNFVPLSNKVFFPNWAERISHDIPFSDGVSGFITFDMKAMTPIYVRNGHTKWDTDVKSSSKTSDGKYFIPGTTIKGCIRNVVETMSFSRMSQVQNRRFGLRDLNNRTYSTNMRRIHCGWLCLLENGTIKLYDWGEPGRISIASIDSFLKLKGELIRFIHNPENFKSDIQEVDKRTAEYKYHLVEKSSGHNLLDESYYFNKNRGKCTFSNSENLIEGKLVLTGQSGVRNDEKKTGKHKEFVFFKPSTEGEGIIISQKLFDDFQSIYKDSPDYENYFRKRLLEGKRIPVFFKKKDGMIHSIGLSYMYKYPYSKSIYDAIPYELKNPQWDEETKAFDKEFQMDMADCLFGYSFGNTSLKGRVLFGHAFLKGIPTRIEEKTFVSSSPHASYYPLYVKGGNDWNNATVISGRKRYPIRNSIHYTNYGSKGMEQVVQLLPEGSCFKEKIYFHNLRPNELGCLLSAISFHGNEDSYYHNMGFGKPYGYGKIKVLNLELQIEQKIANRFLYMCDFESTMNGFVSEKLGFDKWLNTAQIKELFAMAKGISDKHNSLFEYMKMSIDRSENEFLKCISERFKNYTQIFGQECVVFNDMELQKDSFDKKQEVLKKEEEAMKFIPTTMKVGNKVMAECIASKKVKIADYNYEIQLVLPKFEDANQYIGKSFEVEIVQISKVGKISQVKVSR